MNKQRRTETHACQICGSEKRHDLHPAVIVRGAVADLIRNDIGHWDEAGWICTADLQKYRARYIRSLLESEQGELTELEEGVLESMRKQDVLSRNPETEYESDVTWSQRLADRIADVGGSWSFIMGFAAVLILWIGVNSYVLVTRAFDPFPYILLNLILSCLAAVQAPVIMMSQNRQEARDRLRSVRDYQINLKAELEIRQLHQKLDHLLSNQWERLIEIQEIQIDLMNEMKARK